MAEFETIPELSRVLNLSAASLAGISKAQLQFTDAQHLRAEIPLLFMGRYVMYMCFCLVFTTAPMG
jgi:hypothetical protein